MKARHGWTVALAMLLVASAFPLAPAGGWSTGARVLDNDNDPANATALESGKSYNGSVDLADDPFDLYSATTQNPGQVIAVSLNVPTYPTCKIRLAVLDQAQKVQDESFIDSPWQSISFLAVMGNAAYFVSVSVVAGKGDYTLYFALENPVVIAPNQGFSDRPLERAGQNPCDWYVFSLDAGTNGGLNNDVGEFTIDKTAGMVLDVTAYHIWPGMASFTYNISLDHASGGKVRIAASYPGLFYYLRLWARSGSGSYNVTMETITGTPSDNDQLVSTATRLNNTPVTSSVDQAFDHMDFYRFYLVQGDHLTIDMKLNQYTPGMYSLWLVHILNNAAVLVTNVTNFVPGVGWTNNVKLDVDITVTNYYHMVAMAEHGLDAQGNLSSSPAQANYTLFLRSPADINHAPILAAPMGTVLVAENTPTVVFNLNVVFQDPDGDQMFFNVTGSPNLSARINADGGVLVTPAKDWAGSEVIKIAATDIYGSKTTVNVTIIVPNSNQPPVKNRQIANFSLQEDRVQEVDISSAFWDPDTPYGDKLYYWWKGNVSIPMSLDNATMKMSFGPVHGLLVTREITLFVRDLTGATGYMKFTVTINHTNHQPKLKGATRIDLQMPEDGLNNTFLARDFFSDEDTTYAKDVLTYTGMSGAHVNVTVTAGIDGRIEVRPEANWSGEETVFVRATDTGGLYATLEVHAVVDPVNDAPHIVSFQPGNEQNEYPINETENITFSVQAGDIDSAAGLLTYQWYVDGIKANSTGPDFTFFTDRSSSRPLAYKISVEVGDGQYSATRTWNVPVFNKPEAPDVTIISPKEGAVVSDQVPTPLRADVYDPEHGNLAYTWKDGGTTLGNLRTMNWKFSPGWHNVSVHVFYGAGTVVVNVTIFSNSQPAITILKPEDQSTHKTTESIRFTAEVSDADGDRVTFEWREGSTVLSREANFTKKLSKGIHYIRINATDGRGFVQTEDIVLKVEEPPKSGFIPGTETVLLAVAVIVAGVLAFWRRRR